jgi:hypothetical protein
MTADSDTPGNGPVVIVLEADDLRIAAVSYAVALARAARPGAVLSVRSVGLVEGEGGVGAGELAAVVEFEVIAEAEGGPDG